jgi:1-aminocyclopropane-1-carboxylate deaminase
LAVEVLKSNGGLKAESGWLLRASDFRSSVPIEWIDAYHEGGYARTSHRLKSFCRAVLEERTFPVEPIYSGKAFFAVSDLAGKGYFKEDSRILLVHTGGIFPWNSGLLG